MRIKGVEKHGGEGDVQDKLGAFVKNMLDNGVIRFSWNAENDEVIVGSSNGMVLKVTASGDELCLEVV